MYFEYCKICSKSFYLKNQTTKHKKKIIKRRIEMKKSSYTEKIAIFFWFFWAQFVGNNLEMWYFKIKNNLLYSARLKKYSLRYLKRIDFEVEKILSLNIKKKMKLWIQTKGYSTWYAVLKNLNNEIMEIICGKCLRESVEKIEGIFWMILSWCRH